MTVLSDGELIEAIRGGIGLHFDGLNDWRTKVQPATVDLTLGSIEHDDWCLPPLGFRLAATAERIHIPNGLVGIIFPTSTAARRGIFQLTTIFDPGFEGDGTLELFNFSPRSIVLERGSVICQMMLLRTGRPSERPYGHPERKSRYQGQVGIVPAREPRP